MAISSRSPRRGDALARLQSSDTNARLDSPHPPWLPPTGDVVDEPDRDPDDRPTRPLESDVFDDDSAPLGDADLHPPQPSWVDSPPRSDPATPPLSLRAAPPVSVRAAPPRWLEGNREPDLADPAPIERRRRGPRRRGPLMAPPAAIALVVIGLLACVVTVYTVASGSSGDAPTVVAFPSSAGAAASSGVPPAADAADGPTDTATPPSPGAAADPSGLVVSVVGLVRTPGLVHLAGSARIADAISAAGGGRPGADLLSLNMAQPVRDGDQILVGFADPSGGPRLRSAVVSVGGAPTAPTGSAPTGSAPTGSTTTGSGSGASPGAQAGGAPGAKVDLNAADVAALDTLPGVGPVTAAAIVDWRTRNGKFTSVDQLAEVDGIGPGRLAKLRDRVTV